MGLIVVGLVDVDLDVGLVDVDLDVDLVVFLSSGCFLFYGLLAADCFFGFWPPAVFTFLARGCI